MAETAAQLAPILRKRLKDALYARAVEANKINIGGWRDRIADNIGMDRGAVENWFYGNNLPSLSGWIALCQQLPGLQDEVLGDITGERNGGGERREQAAKLRAVADEIEHGGLGTVPHGGKV